LIGVSSLATDHLIVPQLMTALQGANLGHVGVVLGGVIPEDERPALIAAGVAAIFGPGSSRESIVAQVAEVAGKARRKRDASFWETAR
jgi:methylmalonyl-CoA mutase C-terminal domain/subunit